MKQLPESQSAIVHRTSIRVRYADTDQMQIVYNGKYLEYFEVGRTELLRALGLPYSELEKAGTRLPLVEAHAEYRLPARYDDVITIESRVCDYRSARLRIDYRITREENDELLVQGYTVHAFQDTHTLKVTRPPKAFLDVMEQRAPN